MNLLKRIALNVQFYGAFVLLSLTVFPVMVLAILCLVPFVSHRRALQMTRRAVLWYGKVIIFILPFPFVRVRYEDHTNGCAPSPAVVVCNHRSSCDSFLFAALPLGEGVQVINKWPVRMPVWVIGARLAGYLSMGEMVVSDFFTQAARLFKEGISLVALPEGTRSRDGRVGPLHGTMFRLALQEKAPIIPVCISGSERIPPIGTMFLNPGVIRLRQLPALMWEEYKDLTAFQLKNKVRDILARELDAMEATT